MKLFLDSPHGLSQDSWTLDNNNIFGNDLQITVLGFFTGVRTAYGLQKSQKYYVVSCSACALDPDMYGKGLFITTKSHLISGRMPCGCSLNPKWNIDQWLTRARRVALHMGHKFNGVVGEWKGQRTKISMSCERHGEWATGNIGDLLEKCNGCPGCRLDSLKKPDDEMISSFFASGAFPLDTKFWRSDEIGSAGWKEFWMVCCPICNQTCRSRSVSLQAGFLPCGCGGVNKQKECYINLVIDKNSIVALKFGIANNSERRLKTQQSRCCYKIEQYAVYEFSSVSSCKDAERECKEVLPCHFLVKSAMPDGYTETTHIRNLNTITDIYEKHGGVLRD